MSSPDPTIFCYTLERQAPQGGYPVLHLSLFRATEKSLQKRLEGTIDNKAGYGTERAAREVGQFTQELLDQGFEVFLDMRLYSELPTIHFNWTILPETQYAPEGYAGARITFGDERFTQIMTGSKLLKKIGMAIGKRKYSKSGWGEFKSENLSNQQFDDPIPVIEQIERMGGRKVKRIRGPMYMSDLVYDDSPRPWLLTDSLWRTFER